MAWSSARDTSGKGIGDPALARRGFLPDLDRFALALTGIPP
jgi:hypothetical protein